MKRFRKLIFWCHLIAGTLAGIIIFIMSVTGVLLAFEKQLTVWADTRSYTVAAPSTDASRLSVEQLLAKLRETESGIPTGITMYEDKARPVMISYAGGRNLFVNPCAQDAAQTISQLKPCPNRRIDYYGFH
ncbi:MAG: PepSY domain-containing protein [Pyrinomonadaceae bacterium]|nr:PepSY domain-containing protein [Pyrinomonadaceae bacterium]